MVGTFAHTADTVTLTLEPTGGPSLDFSPGQFTMLGTVTAGEAPISISGGPGGDGPIEQTVRDAGGVSRALTRSRPGDILTVRGPYGTGWRVQDGAGGDILLIAGGIGLAPLRSAILALLANRPAYRHITLLYGARSPLEQVFREDLAGWSSGPGAIDVAVTVDHAPVAWQGRVGLVTRLIPQARFDPGSTLALVCGPEVMMRVVAASLSDAGLDPTRIRVSLERNMECGIGLCGHCQLREYFICTDGPVFSYSQVAGHLATREL